MKRYVFIDSEGNIDSICGWGDGRDLPDDYPIPTGCITLLVTDDTIDMNYKYDMSSCTFVLKPVDNTPVVNPPTNAELQKQMYDLITTLVQNGGI